MNATYSVENRLLERLATIDLSAANFAALSIDCPMPISQSRLSQALSGTRPLENQQSECLVRLIEEIEGLVEAAKPIPISLKNTQTIRALLQERRRGNTQKGNIMKDKELETVNKRLDKIERALSNHSIRLPIDDSEFRTTAAEIWRIQQENVVKKEDK
jgi:hypothetical protein